MKKQNYFGKNGHGEKIPYIGYIADGGVFAVRLDENSPTYQRWKIDHLPSGYYAGYARTRNEAWQIVKETMQAAVENNISLHFLSLDEVSFEHMQVLKKALRR